ncbi:MAG: O-methyltransferase [Acidimicrobiales bacterium]
MTNPRAATPKTIGLTADLHEYMSAHSTPLTPVHRDLIAATAALGSVAGMQIAPEQGAFMTMLTRLLGVRTAVEVGTFTGYSSLCIAQGLAEGGRLLCCDVSEEWTSVARDHWQRAGVADRIDLRIAPAIETLRALPTTAHIDLAFIDADKPNYPHYFDEIIPRLSASGVLLVDNVLWGGRVIATDSDENTTAIRAFNRKVVEDPRVECVMLPISDGLTMIRRVS